MPAHRNDSRYYTWYDAGHYSGYHPRNNARYDSWNHTWYHSRNDSGYYPRYDSWNHTWYHSRNDSGYYPRYDARHHSGDDSAAHHAHTKLGCIQQGIIQSIEHQLGEILREFGKIVFSQFRQVFVGCFVRSVFQGQFDGIVG
ncbi:MAG TPA: hypothetical protein PKV72_03925 [Candidatus Peribacteria bacterium]|nr:hypothetical protein [Candidatus Peribacteria bacterium]